MKAIKLAIELSDVMESLNKSFSESINEVNVGLQELLKQLNEEVKQCPICGAVMVKKPG